MMRFVLFFVIVNISTCLNAQKKLLDLTVPQTWPILTPRQISNDGGFLTFNIGSNVGGTHLHVRSTENSWERELTNVEESRFTEDSRRLIYRLIGDTIGILDLSKDRLTYIPGVTGFVTPKEGNGQWMAYLLKNPGNELVLRNLFTDEEKHFSNVANFKFSETGNKMVIQSNDKGAGADDKTIICVYLETGKSKLIGQGWMAKNFVFDNTGKQIAFLVNQQIDGRNVNTIRYYMDGMDSPEIWVDRSIPGMQEMDVSASQEILFSPDGNHIFFYTEKPGELPAAQSDSSSDVEILSYLDDENRYFILPDQGPFLSTIQTSEEKTVVRILKNGDNRLSGLAQGFIRNGYNQEYMLLINDVRGLAGLDSNKISDKEHDICLVSLKDGSRVQVKNRLHTRIRNIRFSLCGKYLCWFDEIENNWFAYEIETGITKNITSKIKTQIFAQDDRSNRNSGPPFPLVGWTENDFSVFIQDRNDIWQVDPEGLKPPFNVTRGFGLKHHIQFHYLDFNVDKPKPFQTGDTLLLSAFNQISKSNGFFRVILDREYNPEKLLMETRMYFHDPSLLSMAGSSGTISPFSPLKAKYANVYAVERMSTTEYPNLFISTDLKEFRPLTFLEPQKKFDWFTTELHHWKLPDGKEATGILYKPENFDPYKKYPVIFYCYEKNADALNCFIHPALSNGTINIPWFVSNGYLVFIPDIYFKEGYPGQSVYNSVVSAALYFSKKKYADKNRMGLQGHSFGGFETNYIIAHTGLFAAAVSSSGISDLISKYPSSHSEQNYYEYGQGRMGVSMWQRPDLYIENSPIFRADKVTTPLLIMHNRNDPNVRYSQAEEWYSGLVREGKKVWMVSYAGEGHTIEDNRNKFDFSNKMMQFFDHYLKGSPVPKWMKDQN